MVRLDPEPNMVQGGEPTPFNHMISLPEQGLAWRLQILITRHLGLILQIN